MGIIQIVTRISHLKIDNVQNFFLIYIQQT